MSSDKKLKAQFEKNKRRSDLSDDDATLDSAIDALIKEASLFHDSAHLQRARWLKIAWSIAAGLGVIAIMLTVAMMFLGFSTRRLVRLLHLIWGGIRRML